LSHFASPLLPIWISLTTLIPIWFFSNHPNASGPTQPPPPNYSSLL
jgi:hypothetical protein